MQANVSYDFDAAERCREKLESLVQSYSEIKTNIDEVFVCAVENWSGDAANQFKAKCDSESEKTESNLRKLNEVLQTLESQTDEMRSMVAQMGSLAGL